MVAVAWMGEAMAGTSVLRDQGCGQAGVLPGAGQAGSGNCYRIKDGDNRNQCLAEIKGSWDRCYAIKDQDSRKACLARAISR
jgi:hypothetical protein